MNDAMPPDPLFETPGDSEPAPDVSAICELIWTPAGADHEHHQIFTGAQGRAAALAAARFAFTRGHLATVQLVDRVTGEEVYAHTRALCRGDYRLSDDGLWITYYLDGQPARRLGRDYRRSPLPDPAHAEQVTELLNDELTRGAAYGPSDAALDVGATVDDQNEPTWTYDRDADTGTVQLNLQLPGASADPALTGITTSAAFAAELAVELREAYASGSWFRFTRPPGRDRQRCDTPPDQAGQASEEPTS